MTARKYKTKGVEVISLASDTVKKRKRFAATFHGNELTAVGPHRKILILSNSY